jgi:hypothetical protein
VLAHRKYHDYLIIVDLSREEAGDLASELGAVHHRTPTMALLLTELEATLNGD